MTNKDKLEKLKLDKQAAYAVAAYADAAADIADTKAARAIARLTARAAARAADIVAAAYQREASNKNKLEDKG